MCCKLFFLLLSSPVKVYTFACHNNRSIAVQRSDSNNTHTDIPCTAVHKELLRKASQVLQTSSLMCANVRVMCSLTHDYDCSLFFISCMICSNKPNQTWAVCCNGANMLNNTIPSSFHHNPNFTIGAGERMWVRDVYWRIQVKHTGGILLNQDCVIKHPACMSAAAISSGTGTAWGVSSVWRPHIKRYCCMLRTQILYQACNILLSHSYNHFTYIVKVAQILQEIEGKKWDQSHHVQLQMWPALWNASEWCTPQPDWQHLTPAAFNASVRGPPVTPDLSDFGCMWIAKTVTWFIAQSWSYAGPADIEASCLITSPNSHWLLNSVSNCLDVCIFCFRSYLFCPFEPPLLTHPPFSNFPSTALWRLHQPIIASNVEPQHSLRAPQASES